MDVQNGVTELEELPNILEEYERNGKVAEVEKERSNTSPEKTLHIPTELQNER